MTGNKSSSLAAQSNILLHLPVAEEACAMDLVPTSSSTLSLAMGDALAVAVMKQRVLERVTLRSCIQEDL